MTIAYPKPFISMLICNLHSHVARQQARNQQGVPTGESYLGAQHPMAVIQTDLWLNLHTNLGSQKFVFVETPTPANQHHNGLPSSGDIITTQVQSALSDSIRAAVNAQLPEFDGSDDGADAKKYGPKLYHRINRLEANLPWGKPAEQVVAAIMGVYMDQECTQQVPDVDFAVLFCNDEFVANRTPRGPQGEAPSPSDIVEMRNVNNWLKLGDLLADQAVQQAVMAIGSNFFTALKSGVPAYADIDVAEVLRLFMVALSGMIPASPE